ncbi:MAG: EAL domain-containing protein [Bacterioplanes sp.]|nr:EAL domain-containing protein [Bacterioplanes sp.]
MSLIKQLWIAIAVLISLTLVSGLVISSYQARSYYAEQLSVKNMDNATSLALTLAQMEKDPTAIELLLAAQFDTGHYRRIELQSAAGEQLVVKESDGDAMTTPAWFNRLMALDIPTGVAQVADGWHLFGTLYVDSHSAYALQALWRVSSQMLFWFVMIAVLCGLVGSWLLRLISQPLSQVVEQAEAIGERRFLSSHEPNTLEFKRVVRAMNRLAERVRSMLDIEAQRLTELRNSTQLDELTGIANRSYFMSHLDSRLTMPEVMQDGLLLVHVDGLADVNRELGRQATDRWLISVIEQMKAVLNDHENDVAGYQFGRLNGSDFALLLHETPELEGIAQDISKRLAMCCELPTLGLPLVLVGSYLVSQEARSQLFSRLDQLMANAEQSPSRVPLLIDHQHTQPLFQNSHEWSDMLQHVLAHEQVAIACFPVVSASGALHQQEAMLRVDWHGQRYPASMVIGWARRLGVLTEFDVQVTRLALQASEESPVVVAVNVSAAMLSSPNSYVHLVTLLQQAGKRRSQRIAFELDAAVVLREPTLFAHFAAQLKRCGASVGLQQVGADISSVPGLERLGLDYLKVDSALVQSARETDVHDVLQGLCKFGHSLGCTMIAEGVQHSDQLARLQGLGFEAFTGPGVVWVDD